MVRIKQDVSISLHVTQSLDQTLHYLKKAAKAYHAQRNMRLPIDISQVMV